MSLFRFFIFLAFFLIFQGCSTNRVFYIQEPFSCLDGERSVDFVFSGFSYLETSVFVDKNLLIKGLFGPFDRNDVSGLNGISLKGRRFSKIDSKYCIDDNFIIDVYVGEYLAYSNSFENSKKFKTVLVARMSTGNIQVYTFDETPNEIEWEG